jgi:hypothetical protein
VVGAAALPVIQDIADGRKVHRLADDVQVVCQRRIRFDRYQASNPYLLFVRNERRLSVGSIPIPVVSYADTALMRTPRSRSLPSGRRTRGDWQ